MHPELDGCTLDIVHSLNGNPGGMKGVGFFDLEIIKCAVRTGLTNDKRLSSCIFQPKSCTKFPCFSAREKKELKLEGIDFSLHLPTQYMARILNSDHLYARLLTTLSTQREKLGAGKAPRAGEFNAGGNPEMD